MAYEFCSPKPFGPGKFGEAELSETIPRSGIVPGRRVEEPWCRSAAGDDPRFSDSYAEFEQSANSTGYKPTQEPSTRAPPLLAAMDPVSPLEAAAYESREDRTAAKAAKESREIKAVFFAGIAASLLLLIALAFRDFIGGVVSDLYPEGGVKNRLRVLIIVVLVSLFFVVVIYEAELDLPLQKAKKKRKKEEARSRGDDGA